MRLEHIPIILGALVGLIGLALLADAWLADNTFVLHERRRRQRTERHRGGEALVGVGALCVAAAFIGRDSWRYGTVSVLLGTVLLLAGAILNWRFIREVVTFRGPARRGQGDAPLPGVSEKTPPENYRIR